MDRSRIKVLESAYDLTLVSAGPRPRRVARTIAELTNRTSREATGMIETAPVLILQGASYATAEGARAALEGLGAEVEMRAYEVDTAGSTALSPSPPRLTTWGVGILTLFIVLIVLAIIFVIIVSVILANLGSPTF